MEKQTIPALEEYQLGLIGEERDINTVIDAILRYKRYNPENPAFYRFKGFKIETERVSADTRDQIIEEFNEYIKNAKEPLPRLISRDEIRDGIENFRGFNLDDIVQVMLEHKRRGESVYYIFNGCELNSDEISSIEDADRIYSSYLKERSKTNSLEDLKKARVSVKDALRAALKSGIPREEIDSITSDIEESITSLKKEFDEQSQD